MARGPEPSEVRKVMSIATTRAEAYKAKTGEHWTPKVIYASNGEAALVFEKDGVTISRWHSTPAAKELFHD